MMAPRTLVILAGASLVASTAFPVVAGLLKGDTAPRALGVADVLVAFVAVFLGLLVASRNPGGFDDGTILMAFRVYRAAGNVLLLLLVAFFLAGDRIRWSVLLPGLAWRAWLFAWALPSGIALWHAPVRETGNV
jgi:hypothetical protein